MKESLYNLGFSRFHLNYALKHNSNESLYKNISKYLEGFSIDPDKLINNYLNKGRKYNLFLWSENNGTGKTTAIHKLALYFWKNRHILRLHSPYMYFDQISSIFKLAKSNLFGDYEVDIFSLMCSVDLLFIDDIDKAGALTEFEMENFRLVVDKRYRDIKPIFFTSNLSLDDLLLKKIIDNAIYSRLMETCTSIKIDGYDNRISDESLDLKDFEDDSV